MSSLLNSSSSSELSALDLQPFHDVRCGVEIVLGDGCISVRECLQLRRGSTIRLAQAAGADLLVAAHGVSIAHGEVVIVDSTVSIRITDIVQPSGVESES